MMYIEQIAENKKRFLDLLLLADEQEDMIDRYLERGELFVLYVDDAPTGVAVVTEEAPDTCELKNLAIAPQAQRRGFGAALVAYLFAHYRGRYQTMLVGTGDCPSSLLFYQHCGFVPSHRLQNFFVDHYDHPMFEYGVQLIDMVYLKKEL